MYSWGFFYIAYIYVLTLYDGRHDNAKKDLAELTIYHPKFHTSLLHFIEKRRHDWIEMVGKNILILVPIYRPRPGSYLLIYLGR